MNGMQLGRALGVSEDTISAYVNRGMPVLSKGTNGQSYELDLAVCYAWRAAERVGDEERKARADDNAARAALLFRNLEEDERGGAVFTAKQIEDESRADYMRNKAARPAEILCAGAMLMRSLRSSLRPCAQT
jgi:phage terminase Nu1 subunit (DNA packaging protein)